MTSEVHIHSAMTNSQLNRST